MPVRLPIRPQPEIEWQLLNLLLVRGPLPARVAYRNLADSFQLSSNERKAMIGQVKPELAWANECRFAKRRLLDLGLVISQPRGIWAITSKGARVAKNRGSKYQSSILDAAELDL